MPSAEDYRLVTLTSLWKKGPYIKTLRLVVDETHKGPFTEVYRLVVDETLSFAGSEYCPPRAF